MFRMVPRNTRNDAENAPVSKYTMSIQLFCGILGNDIIPESQLFVKHIEIFKPIARVYREFAPLKLTLNFLYGSPCTI